MARTRFAPAALETGSYGALAAPIQGQLLRRSERREVAIFLRDGELWVADFIDGEGVLVDAITWFRFNCDALTSPYARRRMVVESAVPLSAELVARIRDLHASATMRKRRAVIRLPERLTAFLSRAWRWQSLVFWGGGDLQCNRDRRKIDRS